MSCDYVRKHYGVPAHIGRRVIAYVKPGVIALDRGNYIGIFLDCDKPGNVNNYHPVDGIVYLEEVGKVRKPSQSPARYTRYIEYADMFDSFIDFCRWDADSDRSWNKR